MTDIVYLFSPKDHQSPRDTKDHAYFCVFSHASSHFPTAAACVTGEYLVQPNCPPAPLGGPKCLHKFNCRPIRPVLALGQASSSLKTCLLLEAAITWPLASCNFGNSKLPHHFPSHPQVKYTLPHAITEIKKEGGVTKDVLGPPSEGLGVGGRMSAEPL